MQTVEPDLPPNGFFFTSQETKYCHSSAVTGNCLYPEKKSSLTKTPLWLENRSARERIRASGRHNRGFGK